NIVLPKLPVPALEQTMERYLATVKPIVSDGQYERTRSLVKAFTSSNGQGLRLQDKILQRMEEQDNWLPFSAYKCNIIHFKTSWLISSSRFLHFPTVDGCNATLNSRLARLAASRSLAYVIAHAAIVICCCIFNAILTND
ncbi:hypothetical protein L9F63_000414, partial [Diploptera punctata]